MVLGSCLYTTNDYVAHTGIVCHNIPVVTARYVCDPGRSPGSQEVQAFTRTSSLSEASVNLNSSIAHGETLFSVVRCHNHAGLQSTLVSRGVAMVSEPPDVSMATVNIIAAVSSFYPARDNHQSDTQGLLFGWEGIRDRSGITGYEVGWCKVRPLPVLGK